jgi:glyoxylase-like metal-dependent hydrolase (beta-lactamase superfamily II)
MSIEAQELGDGVMRLTLHSLKTRLLKLAVTPYLLGDLLIDTGFAHLRKHIVEFFRGRELNVICCTHNHEDHTGNCGILAQQHDCKIYLHRVDAQWSEGVGNLLPYRRLYWGAPCNYSPLEMPEVIESGNRRLRMIPAYGHSQTQITLWEEATGIVFTGDLYISGGVTAVMTQENPYQTIESLRRVAALEPARMLTGHGGDYEAPARRLRDKADRIEEATGLVLKLHQQGLSHRQIVKQVFRKGHVKDRVYQGFTSGEFSRINFVTACLKPYKQS